MSNDSVHVTIAQCERLANEFEERAETLKVAASDAVRMMVDGGKRGTTVPFLRGQAAAYEKAAELVRAMYTPPF